MAILHEFQNLPDTTPDPRLGRLIQFDARSANYPVRAILPTFAPPRSYEWPCAVNLNQGNVGACVGFSWAGDVAAEPIVLPSDDQLGLDIYHGAQVRDPWPGEDYEGTSVLAGAHETQARHFIAEYRWTFSLEDVIDTIGYYGPVIFGINWYEGMFNPDAQGIIHPTGRLAGGHAILGVGVDIDRKLVKLHNSWGKWWGNDGSCFISFDDLNRLLHEGGEGCVPVVRLNPNPIPPQPEPDPQPVVKFVAGKQSNVFHKLTHKGQVGLIRDEYTSYEAAIQAGNRPCRVCKPKP